MITNIMIYVAPTMREPSLDPSCTVSDRLASFFHTGTQDTVMAYTG